MKKIAIILNVLFLSSFFIPAYAGKLLLTCPDPSTITHDLTWDIITSTANSGWRGHAMRTYGKTAPSLKMAVYNKDYWPAVTCYYGGAGITPGTQKPKDYVVMLMWLPTDGPVKPDQTDYYWDPNNKTFPDQGVGSGVYCTGSTCSLSKK